MGLYVRFFGFRGAVCFGDHVSIPKAACCNQVDAYTSTCMVLNLSMQSACSHGPGIQESQEIGGHDGIPEQSSGSALAAIVQRCKTHGIPECSSSKEQRHARLHLLEQSHGGGLGPLLQKGSLAMMDGTTRTVWYTSMLVLLCTMYRECPSFTALLQRRHAQKPSTSESPWSLQLYTDEVVPGNVLGRADRKFWTIYATIMEFDNHAQRENHGFHEQLWFTLCTIRSSIIMQADGGIAQVM